jgi:hypothetical protein
MPKPLNIQNGRVKDNNNSVANRLSVRIGLVVSPRSVALPPALKTAN